jgi:hypothetical protein
MRRHLTDDDAFPVELVEDLDEKPDPLEPIDVVVEVRGGPRRTDHYMVDPGGGHSLRSWHDAERRSIHRA